MKFEFLEAVIRAGEAFNKAKGKDPKLEGRTLAEFLRSDVVIDQESRFMLAALVEGKFLRGKGQPKRSGNVKKIFEVDARFSELMHEGIKQDAIAATLSEEFDIRLKTAKNYHEYAERMLQEFNEHTFDLIKMVQDQYRAEQISSASHMKIDKPEDVEK
jgi:hypothetical protein